MWNSRLISSAVIAIVGYTLAAYAPVARSAAITPEKTVPASPGQNVTFMPRGTIWLMALDFGGPRGGSVQWKKFFANTIVTGFHRMQQRIRRTLGLNTTKQIRSLWAFGATEGPRFGAFILDTTVAAKTITNRLEKNAATTPDLYDGIKIFRVKNNFGRPPNRRSGTLFLAVIDPGIVLGAMNEKLLEQSLDSHLGIKKSLSLKSHLFHEWQAGQPFYFSFVHLQKAIDEAQNPLNVPPQVRQIRSVYLMAGSNSGAVELHGYLLMLNAEAAARSAARLKLLKKMAYHANTGANATDRQMILAGLIEHLKFSAEKKRVVIEWQMPYTLLRHLAPPRH